MSDPIQIGDFRIERQIGAGGMGIVYLATQMSLNRLVALKVLGQSLTRASDKARFQREAQAVAKLDHPNIASVYFVGQDDKLCFMAMEYIDGVSLRECIERLARTTRSDSSINDFVNLPRVEPTLERFDEPAPTQDYVPSDDTNPYRSPQADQAISTDGHIRHCAEIARDVALVLQHAHDQGVIHRDLKPDNLMLDKDGNVHIIDFGVAKFFQDATLTQIGALVGMSTYMSPEQVTSRMDPDARTDIYSLGIVLYELLALQQPINSDSLDGVIRSIVVKPLKPVSKVNSQVPVPLQNIVHKATARDPDDRYQTSEEFGDDLSRFLNGEAVLAPNYRFKVDSSEIRARRPTPVLISAGLVFCLAFVFLVICLFLFQDNSNKSALGPSFYVAGAFLLVGVVGGVGFATGRIWGGVLTTLFLWLIGLFLAHLPLRSRYGSRYYDFVFADYVVLLFGVLCICLGTFAVTSKKTRDWFKLARRIRSEEAADLD